MAVLAASAFVSSAREMFALVSAASAKIKATKYLVIGVESFWQSLYSAWRLCSLPFIIMDRSLASFRCSKSDEIPLIANKAEIIPANYFPSLDFDAIYGRNAPLEVDLGCGDGSYLAAVAAANPARNFLGIERLLGRVRSACRKIHLGRLTNARVLRFEISDAVDQLIPADSISVFHLMFPDPWPKRRHAPRRVVTENFLASIHRALTSCGTLQIATDQVDYFREIERLAVRSLQFGVISDPSAPGTASTFEKRFRQDGVEIHRIVLQKVSDVT